MRGWLPWVLRLYARSVGTPAAESLFSEELVKETAASLKSEAAIESQITWGKYVCRKPRGREYSGSPLAQ